MDTLATFSITPAPWNGIGERSDAEAAHEWRVEVYGTNDGGPLGVFATLYRIEAGEPFTGVIYRWVPVVGESHGFSDAARAMAYALDRSGFSFASLAEAASALDLAEARRFVSTDDLDILAMHDEAHEDDEDNEVEYPEWAHIEFTSEHPVDDGYHATLAFMAEDPMCRWVLRLTYDCGHGGQSECVHELDVAFAPLGSVGAVWNVQQVYADGESPTTYGPVMLIPVAQVTAVHIY